MRLLDLLAGDGHRKRTTFRREGRNQFLRGGTIHCGKVIKKEEVRRRDKGLSVSSILQAIRIYGHRGRNEKKIGGTRMRKRRGVRVEKNACRKKD